MGLVGGAGRWAVQRAIGRAVGGHVRLVVLVDRMIDWTLAAHCSLLTARCSLLTAHWRLLLQILSAVPRRTVVLSASGDVTQVDLTPAGNPTLTPEQLSERLADAAAARKVGIYPIPPAHPAIPRIPQLRASCSPAHPALPRIPQLRASCSPAHPAIPRIPTCITPAYQWSNWPHSLVVAQVSCRCVTCEVTVC